MTESIVATYPPPAPTDITWMLDIDEHSGWPWRAHQIVDTRHDEHGEVRIAACGFEATAGNHPRGWWSMLPGRLPLSEDAIHCSR